MSSAIAQVQNPLLPKTPTAFETRNAGGTAQGDVSVEKKEGKPTKITYTAVTDSRDWKDTTGKVIRARLLAFDAAKGDEANLVRDGKIRLLIDGTKNFSLLSLEKLCTEDRAYIGTLADARKPKASPQKATE
ncbi:MAG: hypothetical protein CFE26_19955 [Verrucomicrobiales bacterium VVV1]|nr:MAG: hypothetical protein CFE26_19955 [Verrucomicrobiales bacterium VVV1]